MTQKTKQIIIVLVIIVIAFIAFKMFSPGSSTSGDTTLVAEQASSTAIVEGQTILALLDNLSTVTLDESVFSNPVFTSLVDFERPIQDQVAGRQNPFLPIGIDSLGVSLTRSTSTAKAR